MGAHRGGRRWLRPRSRPPPRRPRPARSRREPEAAAAGYLEARAAAVTAADPAAALAAWVVPGSALARSEAKVARGAALRGAERRPDRSSPRPAGSRWSTRDRRPRHGGGRRAGRHARSRGVRRTAPRDVEASGVDHTLTLTRARRRLGRDGRRLHRRPQGGVPRGRGSVARRWCAARRAARERAQRRAGRCSAREPPASRAIPRAPLHRHHQLRPAGGAGLRRHVRAVVQPDVRPLPGADCANFASQCARAGDMPQSRGDYDQRLVVRQGGHVLAVGRHATA